VHGIPAYTGHSGGGCATLYAGEATTDADGCERYAAVAGPGTYQHRDYGHSVGWLHEFSVSPDYDGAADDGAWTEAHAVGVKTLHDAAALIAAQVQSGRETPGTDALEAVGLDPSLRSTPGWLLDDLDRIGREVAAANVANRARIAQNAAAGTYPDPAAATYARQPWEA